MIIIIKNSEKEQLENNNIQSNQNAEPKKNRKKFRRVKRRFSKTKRKKKI